VGGNTLLSRDNSGAEFLSVEQTVAGSNPAREIIIIRIRRILIIIFVLYFCAMGWVLIF
jgi:hypothetical protein